MSLGKSRGELRELVPDEAHLVAIALVGGYPFHLFAYRRPDAPPRSGFA